MEETFLSFKDMYPFSKNKYITINKDMFFQTTKYPLHHAPFLPVCVVWLYRNPARSKGYETNKEL